MSETDARATQEPEPLLDSLDPPTSEITYDEQFYPARPRRLRPSARRVLRDIIRSGSERASPRRNDAYVQWLTEQSMLTDAYEFAKQFSGQGSMWQNPYANPDPRAAIEKASVWFTAYPISMITKRGASFLGTLGDDDLWAAFESIGIDGLHTGPLKLAGGISGWDHTPSVDGHFDRISTQIDPAFGTEEEFREVCEVATGHGGTVIDDIVPGHTGKGADFRLAEMKVGDYPGIYHMVEIDPEDWHLLPKVAKGKDSVNLDAESEDLLAKNGYIIGRLQRVIFYEAGVKDTNWSATAPVVGRDGVERRWVYLHYFKEGQPSINWLDPTFAGMRLVIGDALHSLGRPRHRRAPAGRQRLPRRGEERRGQPGLVGGAPAVGGGEPADRQHGAQGGRLHLPGAQPHHRRHQGDVGVRRRPVLRLRQPARLPPRAGHRRHRVPAADAEPRSSSASTRPRWCTRCRTTTS